MNKKTRILLLLWHPQDTIAGGFVRMLELLPYYAKKTNITILDNSPSLIENKFENIKIREYKIPNLLKSAYKIHYALGRSLEWFWVTVSLIFFGVSELKTGKYDVIYGPTGDNPHIFIAGVILKTLFPEKKLLLDVLNLDMPEGSTQNYYKSFRTNGFSLFESFVRAYGLFLLLLIQKVFIKRCDFVVTVSPYMKNVISRYYPKEKIDFTPSGVSIPRNKNSKQKKTIHGIYIGRHTKDKGIFDLIHSWEKVSKKITNANLVTAGSCQKEIKSLLEKEIKTKGIEEKVEMKGLVSEGEKWRLLSSSKYFLHLAYFEPLVPVITILEALACGLPVVMYDVEAIDDYPYLRKHPAIYIVKNKDIDTAVKAVLYIESLSKDEVDRIAIEARKLAKKFSWEEVAQKELGVIRRLYQTK